MRGTKPLYMMLVMNLQSYSCLIIGMRGILAYIAKAFAEKGVWIVFIFILEASSSKEAYHTKHNFKQVQFYVSFDISGNMVTNFYLTLFFWQNDYLSFILSVYSKCSFFFLILLYLISLSSCLAKPIYFCCY